MNLKVKNTSRTAFTLNLARGEDYGAGFLPTRIPFDTPELGPDGQFMGLRHRVLAQPASITWLPGEVREDVPGAVRRLEDFRKAEAVGILRLV